MIILPVVFHSWQGGGLLVAHASNILQDQARKLFISGATTKMLYVVVGWGTPKAIETLNTHNKGTSVAASKLTSTQRAGTLAITGGLQTTPHRRLKIGRAHV